MADFVLHRDATSFASSSVSWQARSRFQRDRKIAKYCFRISVKDQRELSVERGMRMGSLSGIQ